MQDPPGIDERRLRAHVKALAADIGERNIWRPGSLEAAAAYIDRQWSEQAYSVQRQSYRVQGTECANLEVCLPGRIAPQRMLLVGAHYDSVPGSPGADDNASGVAVLLELGRWLRDRTPDLTLRLVAFVNEEPPFFPDGQMGSQIYARAARRRGDDIRLMISLEMLGYFSNEPGSQHYPPLFRFFYPERGDFIALVSNLRSRRLLRRTVKALRASTDVPVESVATFSAVPGVSWSDHRSFWQQGYRALMVTDTAFYRYPYYHSPADTPDRLDYPTMTRLGDGLARALERLATLG